MEECGVFKTLDTKVNPLVLCRFYWTDPQQSSIITGLKSAAGARKIKCLLQRVKDLGWPFMIVVFKGGNITPLGLLVLHIPIFTPEEAKLGRRLEYPVVLSACT